MSNRSTGREETPEERADRNWNDILQELRVIQTGSQVILGFLLAIAFQPRFSELDPVQYTTYFLLVLLAAVVTLLSLAPVGLHRSLFGQRRKPELVRLAARLLVLDLLAIGLLGVGVVAFIIDFALGRTPALIILGCGIVGAPLIWLGVRFALHGRVRVPDPDDSNEPPGAAPRG